MPRLQKAIIILSLALLPHKSVSINLNEALAFAYSSSPVLMEAKFRLKEADEKMAGSFAAWFPEISVNSSIGFSHEPTSLLGDFPLAFENIVNKYPLSLQLIIKQPIYAGGRLINSYKIANSTVMLERESFRNIEQKILLDTVTSYLNIIRDKALLELAESNVNIFEQQLLSSQNQFSVGEITKTDLAQTKASLSRATAQKIRAQAMLEVAQANFLRIVGTEIVLAETEQPQTPHHLIPQTLNEAIQQAQTYHPDITVFNYRQEIAKHNIELKKANFLPSIEMQGKVSAFHEQQLIQNSYDAELTMQMSFPIFNKKDIDGGGSAAALRAARYAYKQSQTAALAHRRLVKEKVTNIWNLMQTANALLISYEKEIEANELAVQGVSKEAEVGTRTVLDVLNAKNELFASKVSLITARHDFLIALFSLIEATGFLNAETLELDVDLYNPQTHYDKVKWQLLNSNIY